MVKVRTTMRPWEPLEVDEREAEGLRNANLLVEDDEKDEARDKSPGATTKDK